jgi:MFS family permease
MVAIVQVPSSSREIPSTKRGSHVPVGAARGPASTEPLDLRSIQLFFLAAALFVVSAGFGALMPLLPAWIAQQLPSSTPAEITRHVGFLTGAYTAGVLVGAPVWGAIADRVGRPRIVIIGMVGYVTSLLLLLPAVSGVGVIYGLRAAAGLCVAAVVPVVPALVAAHTPAALRARRFAWLGAASLLGFLFGPGIIAVANEFIPAGMSGAALTTLSSRLVIIASAVLGAAMMLGLVITLPTKAVPPTPDEVDSAAPRPAGIAALLALSVAVNFVLAGFELGIVLQGRLHTGASTQEVALMFGQCSLVMLAINAMLFFTSLLDKVPARTVIVVGSAMAAAGLFLLALHTTNFWMFAGVSLTSAGTGLVLPVIAFVAAGTCSERLGAVMGGLAAAAGLGQTLGSAAGGWLFGRFSEFGFGWLALPLLTTVFLSWMRPTWWSGRQIANPD